jgi:hypothetical protein
MCAREGEAEGQMTRHYAHLKKYLVWRTEPSHMLGKYSTTESHPQPNTAHIEDTIRHGHSVVSLTRKCNLKKKGELYVLRDINMVCGSSLNTDSNKLGLAECLTSKEEALSSKSSAKKKE